MAENLKELYQKIENYFKFDKANSIFITIVKSIVLLVCGGLFGVIIREYSLSSTIKTPEIYIFFLLIATYIYFEVVRLSKERNFPISILQHLKATEDLANLSKKHQRQNKVLEFIDNSIQSLNSNTCPLAFGEQSNDLCHQDLSDGLKSVVDDLVERTNYFFDIDQSKFTVGVFLQSIRIKDTEAVHLGGQSKNFVFKDDFKIQEYLPKSLVHFDSENDFHFNVLTKYLECIKFSRFLCEEVVVENRKLLLICAPLPNVCENCPSIGVIYTLYEGCETCSNDCENTLLIYGRLLSNWISKYEDCLFKRSDSNTVTSSIQHKHTEVEIPSKMKVLIDNKEKPKTN